MFDILIYYYSEIKVVQADMLDLPFDTECFDVVIEKGTMVKMNLTSFHYIPLFSLGLNLVLRMWFPILKYDERKLVIFFPLVNQFGEGSTVRGCW